jgi:hypothetical protein
MVLSLRRVGGGVQAARRAGLALAAGWLLGAQSVPPGPDAAREALAAARAMLCADCDNDIEAEGVNRPMRRAYAALNWVARAEEALRPLAAAGDAGARGAMAGIAQAREALESVDEGAAIRALEAASAALTARR